MKIRAQILLLVVPLFAALALANGFVFRSLEEREFDRSERETARAIAISLVSWIDRDFPGQFRDRLSRQLDAALICDPVLARLLTGVVLARHGNPWFAWSPAARDGRIVRVRGVAAAGQGKVPRSTVLSVAWGSWFVRLAFTPDVFRPRSGEGPSALALWSGVTVLLGLLLALGIGARVTRSVIALSSSVAGVQGGETGGTPAAIRRVREFDDLAGTLTTVRGVLAETLRAGQRRLVEHGRMRDASAVSRFADETLVQSRTIRIECAGWIRDAGFVVPGGGQPGVFAGMRSGYFFAGKAVATKDCPAHLAALSLRACCGEWLDRGDTMEQSLSRAADIFAPEYLCSVRFDGARLECARYEKNRISSTVHDVPAGEVLTIAVPESQTRLIRTCAGLRPDADCARLLADMAAVFAGERELIVFALHAVAADKGEAD